MIHLFDKKRKNFFKKIRNFSIVAHIDHGKSTLADRFLQITGLINKRDIKPQYLDNMELERERGITIKSQSVRMRWQLKKCNYIINMIDTPGHVDFHYEVSRSLASCEGVLLLIDATQGIEAQTLSNLNLALKNSLKIIPVLNKVDLQRVNIEKNIDEISNLINIPKGKISLISAKTGYGVNDLLNRIVEDIPSPRDTICQSFQAIIFDSLYDNYKGVIVYIRVYSGYLKKGEYIKSLSTNKSYEVIELGFNSPNRKKRDYLISGEVGYLITGVKNLNNLQVGDTITNVNNNNVLPIKKYNAPKPVVFSGIYPIKSNEYNVLKQALKKLQLNDASLVYEADSSNSLGFGYRIGCLGLLHLEIIKQRLEREYKVHLISTIPNVLYRVVIKDKKEYINVRNLNDYPNQKNIQKIYEPIAKVLIISPCKFTGAIMNICQNKRGILKQMIYISNNKIKLLYNMPLSEVILDFFDLLKSKTKGFASMDWDFKDYKIANLVKIDFLVAGKLIDSLSIIKHQDEAYQYGKYMVKKLKILIPRQQFEVSVQASIGSKIISRDNITSFRKNVISKCYGGDITRKRKLLEKQKRGKKRMKKIGNVDIPKEIFLM